MKKLLKITLIIITILIFIIIAYLIDNFRIIEKPLDKVIQIAKEKHGNNINGGIYAYTLEKQKDKIILTQYFAMDRSKSIRTYYVENGVVTKCYLEVHFTSKHLAKDLETTVNDKKIEGNIVSGWANLDSTSQSTEELYSQLDEQFSKFAVKLN